MEHGDNVASNTTPAVSYCLVGQLESYRKLFSASIWNMLSPPPCRKGARAPRTSHAGMLPNWKSRFYPWVTRNTEHHTKQIRVCMCLGGG